MSLLTDLLGGRSGRLASRAVWTIVDQAVSSISNFALSIVIARSVDSQTFGAFAISFTLYQLVVGASQCFGGMPLGVRFSGFDGLAFRRAATAATGTTFILGVGTGLLLVAVGALVGGEVGLALGAMGFMMPGLLVQDCWRSVFVCAGRPASAAINDVFWALTQFAAVGGQFLLRATSASLFVLSWGLAGGIAAMLGGIQFGARPRPAQTRRWVTAHWDQSGFYLGQWAAVFGSAQCAFLLIALLGTAADVGALRAAQVLLGPVTMLYLALYSFALPEIARRPTLSSRRRLQVAGMLSVTVVAANLIWGALLLAVPDSIGQDLLGDTWTPTRLVLPASIALAAASGLSMGPAITLRGMGHAWAPLRITLLLAPLLLILTVVGFLLAELRGAVAGMALAYGALAPLWWIQLRRAAGVSPEDVQELE